MPVLLSPLLAMSKIIQSLQQLQWQSKMKGVPWFMDLGLKKSQMTTIVFALGSLAPGSAASAVTGQQ